MSEDGVLSGDPATLERLRADGVATVSELLARSECVRDLPDRSNHVLRLGGLVLHVKRRKSSRPSAEARALSLARAAGVPVPAVLVTGLDRRDGSIVGCADLAPARPLDDLLREGALDSARAARAFESLASATAALHAAGYRHRDLYLNHVYVDPSSPDLSVTLIDLERMGPLGWNLGRRTVKDLAAIESSTPPDSFSCRARARFLRSYLRARGLPVRTLRGPLLRRVVAKAAKIRRRAPKTPVGDAARPRP